MDEDVRGMMRVPYCSGGVINLEMHFIITSNNWKVDAVVWRDILSVKFESVVTGGDDSASDGNHQWVVCLSAVVPDSVEHADHRIVEQRIGDGGGFIGSGPFTSVVPMVGQTYSQVSCDCCAGCEVDEQSADVTYAYFFVEDLRVVDDKLVRFGHYWCWGRCCSKRNQASFFHE